MDTFKTANGIVPKGEANLYTVTINEGTDLNDLAKQNLTQFERVGKSTIQVENDRYALLLAGLIVDLSTGTSQPPIVVSIANETNTVPLATLGNISVITGKAKSRKTFLVGVITASLLAKKTVLGGINGCLPEDKKTILYFDTEQSSYHVKRTITRICEITGVKNPTNLKPYSLRPIPTEERRKIIEWAIYNTSNLGFVVIDGIRDLVFDINSPYEATNVLTNLLKWTEEKQIHILTVLHQNKSDQNARGHLGTELINKAETVISVVKDTANKAVSTVSAEQCRDIDFEKFSFSIGETGIPFEVETFKKSNNGKNTELTSDDIENLLVRVFAENTHLGYDQLRTHLQESSMLNGIKIPKNKAEYLIKQAGERGLLVKQKLDGKGHEKYCLSISNNHSS